MPHITIITINLNNSSGLRKTIESVVFQSFTDFEFLIIDGGSDDKSIDIIKEYSSQITFWTHEPDNGVYHAMNKGIHQAHGDYVIFLNSGDVFANDRVLEEVVLNRLDADIVSGNAIYEASKFHEMKMIISPYNIKASDLILSFLPHQATFIKRSLFEEISYYNEDLKIIADWAFFIEAILINHKSYKHINLFVSKCDSTGMSSNPANNELMEREFHNVLQDLLPQYYDDFVKLRGIKHEESLINYQILRKFENTSLFRLLLKIRKYLLQLGLYKLKAIIKHEKYLRSVLLSDKIKKRSIEKNVYQLKDNLLNRSDNSSDIIVSVTSYGRRVEDSLPYALYSLFTQSRLPNRIVLYLDNANWNDKKLPRIIKHFIKIGLEVYYCDDYRSYKKLIPALKQFPDNPIITIDDDIYYANRLIESLVDEYNHSDKKTVICHWANIQEKRAGKFVPYSQWQDSLYGNEHSVYAPFGGDGTLYPPYIFDDEILNDDVFMKLAPTTDDIWYWLMEYRGGIKTKLLDNAKLLINENVNKIDLLKEEGSTALYFQNCIYGQNDKQFQSLLDFYKIS